MQVDLLLQDAGAESIAALRAIGINPEIVNRKLRRAQAWISAEQLEHLTEVDNVLAIRAPNYAHARQGSVTTQGDAILRSNQLRNLGVTGQGIKVGIISDGANEFAQASASGDLPATLTRFGNCTRRTESIPNCRRATTCNEGTAMAEIIHDIAPDAELAVAAVSTDLEFIQRLDQLANNFGANIIVDDLGFFAEPFFEDGPLASAVSALPSDILYISSAGNSGNTHYEQNFQASASPNVTLHDFNNNDSTLGFIVPSRGFVVPILQWNTPFSSPTSNYDLFVSNQTEIIGQSTADQSQPGVAPFEAICVPNTSTTSQVNFAIINRFAGGDHRLEMFLLGSSAIEYPTPQGSVFGHPGVQRAIAVGTINASEPGNDAIATYSSQGPARIDFPARIDRAKPDLVGIDGVTVTGAGGFFSPFFGTSAAAPHVAGVAALLKSVSSNATAKNVRDALKRSAVDLGVTGQDSIFGFGRVDALAARETLRIGEPLPAVLLLLDPD